jgi:PilZ domain-containing protein
MEKTATDRRDGHRFEVRLPLRYRVSRKGVVDRMGTGMTFEMSANGLSFRCRKPLPVGAHIDAVIDWPAKYDDVYPVDLQVTGFVVRSDAGRTAVKLTSRKFRVNHAMHQPLPATA